MYSVAQSCPTLCYPMDCSPPSSSVHGISQARILEYFYFYFLLQCILLTQKSNPHLLHWQADSLPLSHVRSPDDMKMNPKPLLNICILWRVVDRLFYHKYQLSRCITWDLWLKFYLRKNEDCSLGDSTSFSFERLPQRGSGGKSTYKVLMKEEFNTIKHLLYKMFSVSHEELMSPWRDLLIF